MCLYLSTLCSNGLGRTGSLCAIYSVLERMKTEQMVDVFQTVKTLRIQRVGLVETVVSSELIITKCICCWTDVMSVRNNSNFNFMVDVGHNTKVIRHQQNLT